MSDFKAGDAVRVVEHDDSTREPREGGKVEDATVTEAGGIYVRVRFAGGQHDVFYQESGWHAWDGMFRWRLEPVTTREESR